MIKSIIKTWVNGVITLAAFHAVGGGYYVLGTGRSLTMICRNADKKVHGIKRRHLRRRRGNKIMETVLGGE